MKKTYINPETNVVLVEAQLMQTESFGDGPKDGSEAVSRRRGRNVWDEEEELDEEEDY